jgi:phospholipid transport system substrate-binding protein
VTTLLDYRHIVSAFAGILALWLVCGQVQAAPSVDGHAVTGPEKLVEDITNRVLTAMEQEKQDIRKNPDRAEEIVSEILGPHVDFERIGRGILGRHWRDATPQQREGFMTAFQGLLLRTYAAALIDYTNVRITYLPPRATKSDGRTVVRTRVSHGTGPPVQVDYRMHREEGNWKVYDVIGEGVSAVVTFRGTFGPEVKRLGMDGLIESLSSKGSLRSER